METECCSLTADADGFFHELSALPAESWDHQSLRAAAAAFEVRGILRLHKARIHVSAHRLTDFFFSFLASNKAYLHDCKKQAKQLKLLGRLAAFRCPKLPSDSSSTPSASTCLCACARAGPGSGSTS